MKALIDGDIVGYKVASACEEAVHWGNDLWTLHADEREARNQVDLWIETILMELRATKAVVYLSDKQNFVCPNKQKVLQRFVRQPY